MVVGTKAERVDLAAGAEVEAVAGQATLVLETRSKMEMNGVAKGEIQEVGRTGARSWLAAPRTARTGT